MGNIKGIVTKLIQTYQTNDPFEIAQAKNIYLRFHDLVNTYGYFSTYKRIQMIHINNRLDENMQRFVCAHELGHAILHPRANTPFLKKSTFFSIDKIEVEASTFAVELLLPDELLQEYQYTTWTLEEIAQIHGVPKEFTKLKTISIPRQKRVFI
jgi:Zn-dependent peptidase ImmA (M78 family)